MSRQNSSVNPMAVSTRFHLDRNKVLLEGQTEVGTWHPDQARVEWFWSRLGVEPSLIDMARNEANLWDEWANDTLHDVPYRPVGNRQRFTTQGWLERYPNIRGVVEETKVVLDFKNKSILDIGGSGKDLVYWLNDRPARIDQVEVSPKSQFLCQSRINAIAGESVETPVYYHTIPAEHIPFDNNSFDFIFSRSTLHHCERPRVFSEIVRVLKPGGILLFVEPHLSWVVHRLVHMRRRILKRDRGTDNPLVNSEIKMLIKILSDGQEPFASYYSQNILALLRHGSLNENWEKTQRRFATYIAFLGRKA